MKSAEKNKLKNIHVKLLRLASITANLDDDSDIEEVID